MAIGLSFVKSWSWTFSKMPKSEPTDGRSLGVGSEMTASTDGCFDGTSSDEKLGEETEEGFVR